MIDVCILEFDGGNEFRRAMSRVVMNRWHMEPGCHIFSIEEDTIKAKAMAEVVSTSPIYVVADNDCLILGENFVSKGLEIMERHPMYGLLAATSISDGQFPNGLARTELPEVMPCYAGGVAFVRKGLLTEFKSCRPDQVDDTICSELCRKGHMTGYMPHLRFNHLGAGYSISNPNWWMKVP